MSLQYASGTRVNVTFSTTATGLTGKREILYNLGLALQDAGWDITTGSLTPTTDSIIFGSQYTPDSNLRMKVNIDTASTNCCRIRAMRYSDELQGTNVASGMFLVPAVSKNWRIIANRHQCFIFETAGNNTGSIAYFGTPWIPSWQHGVVTECYFSYANRISDNTTTAVGSFRVNLRGSYQNAHGNLYANWNNVIIDHFNNISNVASSGLGLMAFHGSSLQQAAEVCKEWADGTELMYDPLIKWPDTAVASQKARIKGQLWDAAIISGSYATEQTFTDGNGIKWYVFTDNSPIDNTTFGPGTLLLRVP
jgi:hypothetical protein